MGKGGTLLYAGMHLLLGGAITAGAMYLRTGGAAIFTYGVEWLAMATIGTGALAWMLVALFLRDLLRH